MGGSTSKSTATTTIPPEVMARYNAVNATAETAANTPFKQYSTNPNDFVAPMNATQNAGVAGTNQYANAAQPYYGAATDQLMNAQAGATPFYGAAANNISNAQDVGQAAGAQSYNTLLGAYQGAQPYQQSATQYAQAGAQAVDPRALTGQQINQYMDPYLHSVVGNTANLLNQQNQQAMAGQTGNAIRQGAFGGDRAGIAAAVLQGQQNMASGNVLSGLLSQGYGQALQTAQQQQGLGLSAAQANRAAQQQAAGQMLGIGQQGFGQGATTAEQIANLGQQQFGQGMTAAQQQQGLGQAVYGTGAATSQGLANLGSGAQAAGLQGAEAQLAAGQVGQQTEQAGKTALFNQFQQQQSYPFQTAQFLANIAEGTGALSGNTSSENATKPLFAYGGVVPSSGGGSVTPMHYGEGYAGGGAPNGDNAQLMQQILQNPQGMYGPYLSALSGGTASSGVGPYGGSGVVPAANLPMGHLAFLPVRHRTTNPESQVQSLQDSAQQVEDARNSSAGQAIEAAVRKRLLAAQSNPNAAPLPENAEPSGQARGGVVGYAGNRHGYATDGAVEPTPLGTPSDAVVPAFNPSPIIAPVPTTLAIPGGSEDKSNKESLKTAQPKPGESGSQVEQIGKDVSTAATAVAALMALARGGTVKGRKGFFDGGPATSPISPGDDIDSDQYYSQNDAANIPDSVDSGSPPASGVSPHPVAERLPTKEELDAAVKAATPVPKAPPAPGPSGVVGTPRPTSGFNDAVSRTLGYEGGESKTENTNFGINQQSHPDVDVHKLTPATAIPIYKKEYWDAIGADQMSPDMAPVAFDTAVNLGVGATKKLLTQAGGDPNKLLDLRKQYYDQLISANPAKFGIYQKGWDNRVNDLRNSLLSASASAPVAKAPPAPGVAGPQGDTAAPTGAGLAGRGVVPPPPSTGDVSPGASAETARVPEPQAARHGLAGAWDWIKQPSHFIPIASGIATAASARPSNFLTGLAMAAGSAAKSVQGQREYELQQGQLGVSQGQLGVAQRQVGVSEQNSNTQRMTAASNLIPIALQSLAKYIPTSTIGPDGLPTRQAPDGTIISGTAFKKIYGDTMAAVLQSANSITGTKIPVPFAPLYPDPVEKIQPGPPGGPPVNTPTPPVTPPSAPKPVGAPTLPAAPPMRADPLAQYRLVRPDLQQLQAVEAKARIPEDQRASRWLLNAEAQKARGDLDGYKSSIDQARNIMVSPTHGAAYSPYVQNQATYDSLVNDSLEAGKKFNTEAGASKQAVSASEQFIKEIANASANSPMGVGSSAMAKATDFGSHIPGVSSFVSEKNKQFATNVALVDKAANNLTATGISADVMNRAPASMAQILELGNPDSSKPPGTRYSILVTKEALILQQKAWADEVLSHPGEAINWNKFKNDWFSQNDARTFLPLAAAKLHFSAGMTDADKLSYTYPVKAKDGTVIYSPLTNEQRDILPAGSRYFYTDQSGNKKIAVWRGR